MKNSIQTTNDEQLVCTCSHDPNAAMCDYCWKMEIEGWADGYYWENQCHEYRDEPNLDPVDDDLPF